jgi:hypothetical protein
MKKKRDGHNHPNCFVSVLLVFIILVSMFAFFMFRLSTTIQSLNETFEPIPNVDAESLRAPVTGCLEQWGGSENQTAIEQGAGISFPASASNITASSVAFMDCSINVRFSMAATDLDSFLASTYVNELTPRAGSTLSTLILNYDVDWHFDGEKLYLVGEGNNSGMEHQDIVVDTSNETIYIVYVVTLLL